MTISEFLQREFLKFYSMKSWAKVKNKSDLNLLLGAMWKVMGLERNYDFFSSAFSLLTELRAYCFDEEVLANVLKDHNSLMVNPVLTAHRILERLDIIDEHKAYFLLAQEYKDHEYLLSSKDKSNVSIAFMGFDTMTPMQVDFIQALGKKHKVYIPFDKDAFEYATDLDWIHWIQESQISNIEIKKRIHNKQIPLKKYKRVSSLKF